MAYLQEQMKILKFDKRMLEINLKNGSLTEADYKSYLSQLRDMEANSEKLVLEEGAAAPEAPTPAPVSNNPFGESVETNTTPVNTPPNSDPFGSGF